jgi:cyclopropane-fatty-acyl-phospholipid synthase
MFAQFLKNRNMAVVDGHSFLQDLMGGRQTPPFAVRFWDGTTWNALPDTEPRFTIVFSHPGALRSMFLSPTQLTLGEAYIYGDFDIEGDIVEAFTLAELLCGTHWKVRDKLRYGRYLSSLSNTRRSPFQREKARFAGIRHSRKRDAQAVCYHYNVSNDFYRLWLDEQMVYSCAYFAYPNESLDKAQLRKLDYICRKLRLKRGERLLDIGCGWGGLILHAARNYGVEALGITLSRPQADLANERIREAGLSGRCRAEVRDYREVDDPNGFDKLVSVGMFEHVGKNKLDEYFSRAWRLLRPGGVFLNHGIAESLSIPALKGPSFIDRYVFPDGELLPVCNTLHAAENSGFEVRDLESLREQYALTLRQWVERLERHYDEVRHLTDEVTYRIWRLYMAGATYGFEIGRLNLYQALLAKTDRGRSGLPLTRSDWYVPIY